MSTTTAAARPSQYAMPKSHFESVKSWIAARLRAVCAGMPEEEFDALIARMASLQIKYELREQR